MTMRSTAAIALAVLCLALTACETEEGFGIGTDTDFDGSGDGDVTIDADADDTDAGDTDVVEEVGPDGDTSPDADADTEPPPDTDADVETDPCGDACVENEVCDETGDTPVCVCAEGFIESDDGCVDDPCDGACLENEVCDESGEAPACVCPEGFVGTEDACTDIDECDLHITEFSYDDNTEAPSPDCITDSVCLARSASGGPIYNTLAEEPSRDGCDTVWPSGTEWALGACAGADPDDFGTFARTADCSPSDLVDTAVCLHVIAEDVYFDVVFSYWGVGEDDEAGIFAYTRNDASPCGANSVCTNTPGDFECACEDGYADEGEGCLNIDECAVEGACPGTAVCYDEPGSFTCLCPPGEVVEDDACVDADACDAATVMPSVSVFHEFGDDPDCLTDSVCFDRGDRGPIYNSEVDEPGSLDCESAWGPSGTEWHTGRCGSGAAEFVAFGEIVECDAGGRINGYTYCLHVVEEDRFFDIEWTAWGSRESDTQGQFGYVRTEVFPPCGAGATCTDGDHTYTCECDEGLEGDPYTGCIDSTACTSAPCGETDICFEALGGGFGCVCNDSTTTFTKTSFGDEEDCILPGLVCITRGDDRALYNSVVEGYGFARGYNDMPSFTWWAPNPCADASHFLPFFGGLAERGDIPAIVDVQACMNVGIDVDGPVWIDVTFDSWDDGDTAAGGGFSYTRERVVFDTTCTE